MKQPEIIPGVGEPLPSGERLLWTGAPSVRAQLRHGLLLRLGLLWVAVAAVLPFLTGSSAPGAAPAHLAWALVVGGAVFAMAWGFAVLVRKTTTYALTDQRVVMRVGIALPAVLNIPLDELAGASCRAESDGSGDVSLPIAGRSELGFALLWPHVRPWKLAKAEPSMRWLEGVEEVAGILTAAALDAGSFEPADRPSQTPTRERTPRAGRLEGSPAGA